MKTPIPSAGIGRRASGLLPAAFSYWSSLLLSFLLVSALPAARAVVFTSQLVTNLPFSGGIPNDSFPSTGAVMGGYFYFAATDGTNGSTGRELWRTDGTPGGTTLVKDICPGDGDSSPHMIVAGGTNLFFVATDGMHGQQLWKSDGTAAGTVSISSLPKNAAITAILPISNGLYYTVQYGNDFIPPIVLYRWDGTPGGTFAVNGPGGFPSTNYLSSVDVSGDNVVYVTLDYYDFYTGNLTNTLWSLIGTGPWVASRIAGGTDPIGQPRILGTNCYFGAGGTNYYTVTQYGTNYSTNYYRAGYLWRSGLYGGPQLVDTSPWGYGFAVLSIYGYDYFPPYAAFTDLVVTNGHLFYDSYYSVRDPYPLGVTNAPGPWMAVGLDSTPVTIDSVTHPIIGNIGANTYYWAGTYTTKIFQTDGASGGVLALDVGPLGFSPYSFLLVGSLFYFQNNPSSYTGMGVTDLTPAGTHLVSAPPPLAYNLYSRYPDFMGALGNLALYHLPDAQAGDEPYRSDGTTNGTFLLKDIAPGTNAPPPTNAVASGGLFYFAVPTPATGTELWRSDGTAAGTFLLKDINPGTNSSFPNQLTACNGLVFFSANDGSHGPELWSSDGTPTGTHMVKDIRLGAAGSNPTNLVSTGTNVFFVADDGSHGAELWVSDGTAAGTYLVQDIVPGIGSGNIRELSASGGEVHFLAGTSNTSGQLWFSIPQPGGAQFLYDFYQYSPTWPRDFTFLGGKTFFGFQDSYYPQQMHLGVTDDTPAGTGLIASFAGEDVSTAGGVLFTTYATNLLTSDGTAAGTVVLTNLAGGVGQLTPLGSNMYFTSGAGVWSSDGTTNGTLPAAQFSDPTQPIANLTPFQGTLIFNAGCPTLGRELWATAPGQGATLIEDLSPQTGSDNLQLISAATNQVFYIAKPAGQAAWQLRTLQLQSILNPTGPYGGTPWPVPGLIEAENYDLGGDPLAYHDTTADNEGGVYRPYEGVDIEACNDTNGGFCVFQTRPGEWMDYTVNAAYTGLYQIEIRMTSAAVGSGLYHIEIDGILVAYESVRNNGTPGSWISIIDTLPFFAGVHVVRVVFDQATSAGDVGVFNYFNFTALATNQPPTVFMTAPPASSIVSTDQPVVLGAQVIDPTTWYAPTVEFFVDGQSLGVVSTAPYHISWNATPGPHNASAIATDSFGASSASSNLLFFVAEPLLPNGSFWRANPFGTNLPNTWRNPGYDDSRWPRLRAPFGFGYRDIATLTPSNFNGSPIPTFYFRTTFTNALSNFNFASLTLTRDDAGVVWINGQLLARINLPQPPTNVVFTNLALTNVVNNSVLTNAAVDILTVPQSLLLDGTNLIAVEIHQGRPDTHENFDMKFDLSFSTFLYTPAPTLTIFGAMNNGNNGGVTVQWPDSLSSWTLEHSFDLSTWNTVNGTPLDTNGFLNLILSPPLNPRDFFRLHNTNGP